MKDVDLVEILVFGGDTIDRLILRVGGDVTTLEVNVVSVAGPGQSLVVHLNGLHLAGLDESCLHTAHKHCSDTADVVDILVGQPERLVLWGSLEARRGPRSC
jgi:hypothetical protein